MPNIYDGGLTQEEINTGRLNYYRYMRDLHDLHDLGVLPEENEEWKEWDRLVKEMEAERNIPQYAPPSEEYPLADNRSPLGRK